MMLCNLGFVTIWERGGSISLHAELTRLTQVHNVTFVQSCEIHSTGNHIIKTGKENPVFGFLVCVCYVEDMTRNLESFA